MKKAFIIVLTLLIISVIVNVLLSVKVKKDPEHPSTKTIIDTLFYDYPVPVDSFVIRHITKIVPVIKDSVVLRLDNKNDSINPIVIVKEDSASVIIPITQKIYEDSTYRAYVSGYNPSLDSIKILRFTEQVNIRAPTKQPRFSVGIQGGYGYTPKGFQPYIGVGVTVNLWSR